MIWGADMLLLSMPSAVPEIEQDVKYFLHSWMNGNNGVAYTPQGLAWTTGGAPLRNVANAGETLWLKDFIWTCSTRPAQTSESKEPQHHKKQMLQRILHRACS